MATANIDFYQRQKDLHDKVTKSEHERLELEKQLKLLTQSDQNSSQLKAARLHSYWKKICMDEKRAQQRNIMLVREFERIDAHLSSLEARKERLNFLKQQYADYIEHTYPEWTQKVGQKMREETRATDSTEIENGVQSNTAENTLQHSQDWLEAEKEVTSEEEGSILKPVEKPYQACAQPLWLPAKVSGVNKLSVIDPATSNVANISAVMRSEQSWQKQEIKQHSSLVKLELMDSQKQQEMMGTKRSPLQNENQELQSEYMNINVYSNQHPSSIHIGQGDQGQMNPGNDDEDMSDFRSDSELPRSAGDASPVKAFVERQGSTQPPSDSKASRLASGSMPPGLTLDGLIRLVGHIKSGLTTNMQGTDLYSSPNLNQEEKLELIIEANKNGTLQKFPVSLASHLMLEQMSHVVWNLPEKCLIKEQFLRQTYSHLTPAEIGRNLSIGAQQLWTAVYSYFVHLKIARVMEAKEIANVFVPRLVADHSQYQDKAFLLLVHLLEKEDGEATNASPQHLATPDLGGSGSLMEDCIVPPLQFGSLVDKPFSDDDTSFYDQSLPRESATPLNETSAYQQMLSGTFSAGQRKVPQMSDDTDDDVEKEFASVLPTKSSSIKSTAQTSVSQSVPVSDQYKIKSADPKSPVYIPTAADQKSVFGSTGSGLLQRRQGIRLGSDFESDSEMEARFLGSNRKSDQGDKEDDFDFYD